MTLLLKLFNGLPANLMQAEFRLYTTALVLLQDWTLVPVSAGPAASLAGGAATYQASIPLPAGFTQGYIVSRSPGDPSTESFPEPIGVGLDLSVPPTVPPPILAPAPVFAPAPAQRPGSQTIGLALARQRDAFVQKHGSAVTLPSGAVLKALVKHGDHDLLRSIRSDGDAPEKRPIVLVFGPGAWGVVTEGAKVSIGAGGMLRTFIVADPLHPKWRQDVVTELVALAFPD